jgi:hypothetical protein
MIRARVNHTHDLPFSFLRNINQCCQCEMGYEQQTSENAKSAGVTWFLRRAKGFGPSRPQKCIIPSLHQVA